MSKRKQHPLIVAMNKFEQLLTTLDSGNAEAFIAYVRNKVATKRPKVSPAAQRVAKKSSPKTLTEAVAIGASSGTGSGTASSAGGSGD